MASSSTHRASSSTCSNSRNYDVFLSFRGADTRKNFTDHLYTALVSYGIITFRDDEELEKGGDIATDLSRAIEESRIFIIIFSKNYADSRWCLNELVKIIECSRQKESVVVPVFYHVDPSDVRKQGGSFGAALTLHERDDADVEKKEMIKKWRIALNQVGNLCGYHVVDQHESVIVENIVNDIRERLNCKILHVGENIVGMDIHLDKVKSLINIELKKVRMIGIYGIGGIGKTTIAKAVCNSISSQFDGTSFLQNIREIGNCCGILQLQQKLLHDILKGRNMNLQNIDEGINVIKDRLHSKRVLIVVDDVDNSRQLEYIVGKHDWFFPGSRIIITTRDKHLLDVHGVDGTYEAKELNYEESIELFSRYAFKQSLPKDDYKNLLNRAIEYAKGLPLALKVLGIFLFSKTIPEWEDSLCKLENKLHMEIYRALKISFDGLDDKEKEIFLDIACFFKGKDKDFVSRILGGCNFYVESGIRVLVDKCLLTVSNNKLDMHDLLQHMGWEMVREQCWKEPGKRSRLWEGEDVRHVITRNTGTEAIEGIILDMSTSQIKFTTKAFKKMQRLRLLKVHRDAQYDSMVKYCKDVPIPKGQLPRDFTFPSYDLRYLHWDGYPLKSLPSSFHAWNLVELSLQSSGIKKLWDKKVFKKLKVLNLSYSKHLIKIPESSSMPNVEMLIVKGCKNLKDLPGDIYKLKYLKILCCTGCSKLKYFPEIMEGMENLRELYLDRTGISNLPRSIEHLNGIQYLDLAHCENLEYLPESIHNLCSLKTLLVNYCSKLEEFPLIRRPCVICKCVVTLSPVSYWIEAWRSVLWSWFSPLGCLKPEFLDIGSPEPESPRLGDLEHGSLNPGSPQLEGLEPGSPQSESPISESPQSESPISESPPRAILSKSSSLYWLEELDLSYCNLEEGEITSEVFHLPSLQVLNLSGNNFCKIPLIISKLSKLRILKTSHCKSLLEILELPSNLREIDAHGCPLLLPLQKQTQLLHSLLNCFKSDIQDFERGFGSSDRFMPGSLYDGKGISLFIDGSSGFPEWIRHQNVGNEVIIQLPVNWHEDNDLLGFSLFSFHVPVNGFEEKAEGEDPSPCSLKCELTFLGEQFGIVDDLFLDSFCGCNNNGGASDQMWVTYYPKVAVKEMYHSNNYRCLKASFRGTLVKVEKCGINLIYAKDDGSHNVQRSSWLFW